MSTEKRVETSKARHGTERDLSLAQAVIDRFMEDPSFENFELALSFLSLTIDGICRRVERITNAPAN